MFGDRFWAHVYLGNLKGGRRAMMGSRCCSALNYFQCGADAKNSKNCSSGNDCSSFLPSVTVLEQGGWEMSSLPINLWLEYQCHMSRGPGFQLDSRYPPCCYVAKAGRDTFVEIPLPSLLS